MIKYIIFISVLIGCADNKSGQKTNDGKLPAGKSNLKNTKNSGIHYNLLKEDMLNADSVILLSHHSPYMPIINPKTGKYYKNPIPFIENNTINYKTSVQEKKKLKKKEIEELISILILPAIDNSIASGCFQPRNAVVIFKENKMSCFDFCFDCQGFTTYGNLRSELIMNSEKYQNLVAFFIKYNFKYELE